MTSAAGEKEPLDVLSVMKLVGGFGVLCYAAGFVVVAIYSQIWSFTGVTLLNVRYVGVGLCFLMFLGVNALLAYYSGRVALVLQERRLPRHPLAARSCSMLLFLVVAALASVALIEVLATGPSWNAWVLKEVAAQIWSQGLLFIVGWHVTTLAGMFLLFALLERRSAPDARDRVHAAGLLALLIAVLFVIGIKTYSRVIYPVINPAFGGAQVTDVQLLIDKMKVREAGLLVPLEEGARNGEACWTRTLELVDQNEMSYFVLIPDNDGGYSMGRQIDKALVVGLKAATASSLSPPPPAQKAIFPEAPR